MRFLAKAEDGVPRCGNVGPKKDLCDRERDHDRAHAAHHKDGSIKSVWPQR